MNANRQDLLKIEKFGMHWICYRGFSWFRNSLLPYLRLSRYRSLSARSRYLQATAWYYIGHLHDCNGAPRAAIRAYKRSAAFDPRTSEAWREIGEIHSALGEHREALTCLRRSLTIDPTDEIANADMCRALASSGRMDTTSIEETKLEVRIAERLAKCQPRAALRKLKGMSEEIHLMARVYGALDDADRALSKWRRLIDSKVEFEVTGSDLFHLPVKLWDSAEFWSLFEQPSSALQGFLLFEPGSSELFDPPDLDGEPYSQALKLRRIQARARFQRARVSADVLALDELHREFPRWTWINFVLDFIRTYGRAPKWNELWLFQETLSN